MHRVFGVDAVPIDGAVFLQIILGSERKGQFNGLAVFKTLERDAGCSIGLRIIPLGVVVVIIRGVLSAGLKRGKLLIVDGHGEEPAGGVSDERIVRSGYRAFRRDRITLGHVLVIHIEIIRISAEIVRSVGPAVVDAEPLGFLGPVAESRGHIGLARLFPALEFKVRADVGHGGLGPAAVVADNGDGVHYADIPVLAVELGGVDIAFDVSAAVVIVGDVVESDVHAYRDAAGGGDRYGVDGAEHLKGEIRVMRRDLPVAVEAGVLFPAGERSFVDDVLEQRLGVFFVKLFVGVEVELGDPSGNVQFAVDRPSHVSVEPPGTVVVIPRNDGGAVIVGHGVSVRVIHTISEHVLRKELSVDVIVYILVGEVVDIERK